MVTRLPVVVERTSSRICAGHGRYSYCQPANGFSPSWFAVIAVEKMNCGISVHHRARVLALEQLARVRRHQDGRLPGLHSMVSCTPTRELLLWDLDFYVYAPVGLPRSDRSYQK